MAVDSASDILAFKKQGTGNNLNTWGDELNNALDRISEAIADRTTKSLTGNYTLTSTNYVANESRSAVLVFSDGGLSSTPTVTLPARKKLYWAKNTGSTYGVTLEVSGGTSVTIPTGGRWVFVLCDGTDCEIHDPSVSDLKAPTTALAMNSQKITGLADPTSAQDAATKAYVDTEVATVVSDAGAAAAASASAAATSASNASTSETNAASSASAASTSATNASNSATAAATSASDAADSATDAANSAASAASKIEGPASATNNALVQFDGTTGKLAKDGPTIGGGANQIPQLNGSGFLDVSNGGTGAGTFTDGGVLVGNGTGAMQATAVGTAGQVLTSNGSGSDPTFQDAAGGGMEQIGTTTVSSPVASVEFTSIPSTYDHLYVSIKGISPSSNSVSLRISISNDNGSTYSTPEDMSSVTSVASQGFYGGIVLFGYQSGAGVAVIAGKPSLTSPDIEQSSRRPLHWRADGGVDAIQFTWSAGNLDAGTITLYGY